MMLALFASSWHQSTWHDIATAVYLKAIGATSSGPTENTVLLHVWSMLHICSHTAEIEMAFPHWEMPLKSCPQVNMTPATTQAQQETVKSEPLSITYSYWDGSGHRRNITVKKGDTIGQFLKAVREQLATQFRELRHVSVDNLMYIKVRHGAWQF